MAKEQPNVGDLLHLLETSDLHELEEVRAAINEHLNADRGSIFLNSLVDYYLETNSGQALHILSSVREPHDKHLLDKLNDCMTKSACRLATLTLLEHVIRKQPPWIHKVSRAPILQALLKCLKTDTNIVVLITGVLVLIILLPMIPQPGKQNLYEFFDIFGRLASWNLKTPGNTPEVYLIHLHVSVYALFHRLYGMYPCNFVSYLRSHYSMKENMETFEEIVKPMLEHVRIHPELVTGTKDHELDPTRWKRFEIHDIVIECAKVSLDPKEASCEEGYSSIPEHFTTHLQHRQTDITDPHSCYTSASSTPFTTPRQTMAQPSCRSPQTLRCSNDPNRDVFWSPSTVCGMSTPPSSRGISPTNVASELSHSAPNQPCRLHNTPVGNKGTISNTPTTSSPPHFCSDEYVNISVQPQTITPTHKDMRPGTSHDYDGASSVVIGGSGDAIESKTTMTLDDLPQFIKELEQQDQKEREDDAIREELHNITEGKSESPGPRGGFDSPFYRTTETLTDGERKHAIPAHPALIAASSCGLSSDNALCTPDKLVPAATTRTDNQGAFPFKPVFTPIDRPVLQTSEGHVSVTSEERQKPLFTPSPCKAQTAPYEALFELALPKAAALFVARKTAEAAQRVGAKYPIEDDGKWHVSTSPLEVLDCLIQQGKDAHVRELNRLPLPSKSADWTHYGGSPPSDEIQTLRSQLLLLHNQLLYERYKREQHAVRNRRLLRRIINATALEEQNNAMKDQLKLQEDDIQSLKASLSEEQARNKKLREEHETMVSQLHTQIRQLQQGCDKYSTANQELQSKLMEYKKAAGDLRVELQKANNKICNTGHLLNQLRQKLTNSETVQQQMEFLNKQLLLLGEVNELYMEELRQSSPDNSKEEEMLKIAYEKENEKLRYNAIQQSQRLEAAQRRIVELETQFTKKEHLLMEQKKYLEDFKSQASHQLLAAQSRYITQKQITQVLEREMSELYSQLEKKNLLQSAGVVSDKRAGGRATEANTPMDSRSDCGGVSMSSVSNSDCTDVHQAESPKINKSTLSYRPPPSVSPGGGSSVNGRQDPPVLMEPSPSHSSSSSTSSATNDTPMTVGSYPSAKSFLTMRNRELFRNKSESQCDDEVPRLSSLSQVLKTEQCPDPLGTCAGDLDHCKTALGKEENTDGQQTKSYQEGTSQQRQQHLRIMDYNESHHDHS